MQHSVGVVGLGKLGLPLAVTLAFKGHRVLGFDRDPRRMSVGALSPSELTIDGSLPLLSAIDGDLPLNFTSLQHVVNDSECVLIAVETPHLPEFEGITPLPKSREDFNYESLCMALNQAIELAERPLEIGIISTVMPGTMRARLLPIANGHRLVYCPQFIAMGTVARDVCFPEFLLFGTHDQRPQIVREVFEHVSSAPIFAVSLETAELTKVIYNTHISMKVAVSNTVQHLSERVGAFAPDVFAILRAADRRLCSTAYIGPGMGDGGPCHPRDNIALSWLTRQVSSESADIFDAILLARQAYVEWLAYLFVDAASSRPLIILGAGYKPGARIKTGSSTLLLAHMLTSMGREFQLVEFPDDGWAPRANGAAAFFLGCPEQEFVNYAFPPGSVIVDPWFAIEGRKDVQVIHPGASGLAS